MAYIDDDACFLVCKQCKQEHPVDFATFTACLGNYTCDECKKCK